MGVKVKKGKLGVSFYTKDNETDKKHAQTGLNINDYTNCCGNKFSSDIATGLSPGFAARLVSEHKYDRNRLYMTRMQC